MSNLIRYNEPLMSIFDELEKIVNNNVFSKNVDCWLPNVDIKDEDKAYLVKVDIPGMDKKNIKISVDQYNNLIIDGERDSEVKKESKGYICFERRKGSFFRKMALPSTINSQNIKAKYQNGVLEINIPKAEENLVKQIDIES